MSFAEIWEKKISTIIIRFNKFHQDNITTMNSLSKIARSINRSVVSLNDSLKKINKRIRDNITSTNQNHTELMQELSDLKNILADISNSFLISNEKLTDLNDTLQKFKDFKG